MTTSHSRFWRLWMSVAALCAAFLGSKIDTFAADPPSDGPAANSQPASPASGPSSARKNEETISMKEFVVSGEADSGYSTANAIGVTRTNEALIDTPQTINVINQNMMQDFQPGDLSDVLKYVPGVTLESNVGDSTMIRGFTVRNQFTDGLVDNQNQSQAGADPFQYERIEVIKGPEGLVYGSTAIGGVTNRVRKKPSWQPRTELAFTVGNHDQTKTELDANIPLNRSFAFRVVAMFRDENLVNGVAARFAYFNRWIVNPSMNWHISDTARIYIFGEFLGERGYKHWGENGMFLPQSAVIPGQLTAAPAAAYPYYGARTAQFGVTPQNGAITTWGLLPRDFTFGEKQGHSINHKQAAGVFYEASPLDNWLLRIGGTVNFWDHYVEDIIPVNMAADNVDMTRLWRTLANTDFYSVFSIDSTATFKILGTQHRLFAVTQYQVTGQNQDGYTQNTARPIQPLNLYNPIYIGYNPYDKVHNNLQYTETYNYSFGFKDHIRMFGDKFQIAGGPRYDWFSTRLDNNLPATPVPGKTNSGNTWTYNYGAILKPTPAYSVFYGHSETYNPNFGAQPDGSAYPSQTGQVDEVGLKMAFLQGRVAGTISTYNLLQNHILLADPDPTRATAGYKVDSGQNKTKGQEADVFVQVTKSLLFSVGGGNMRYKTTANNIEPRGAPENTANSTLRYSIRDGRFKGFAIGGGFTYKSKFNVEAATATQVIARYYLPGYHTVDLWTSYHWRKYAFQFNVSNVGDTWYLQRSTSKDQIWQGPERLVKLRISRVY